MGPLQNEAQFRRVHALIEQAIAQGATLLTGGQAPAGLREYSLPRSVWVETAAQATAAMGDGHPTPQDAR